jgi:hypothetical protein
MARISRRAVWPLAAATALLAAGCGDSRTTIKSLSTPVAPGGFHTVTYAGVTLSAPNDWSLLNDRAPLVVTISSGTAVIALWSYPSSTPPPAGATALAGASTALQAAAKHTDPGLRVIRSAVTSVDGDGAVELDAIEQIDGQTRRVRSMHVYTPGSEIVLEEYAPPALFHAVDHDVFSPVKRSLTFVRAGAA